MTAGARPLFRAQVTAAIADLILFATESTNPDPFTREGMPVHGRQTVLREQGVLDQVMRCIQHPFRRTFSIDDLAQSRVAVSKLDPSRKAVVRKLSELRRLGILCMRLARHVLRGNHSNKMHAMRFVPVLQVSLGYGLQAADTLREVFADNVQMLEGVTDEHVDQFVSLIRETGRQARYIEFLESLCLCSGKAVRPNQVSPLVPVTPHPSVSDLFTPPAPTAS